jgi:hypothetical protein
VTRAGSTSLDLLALDYDAFAYPQGFVSFWALRWHFPSKKGSKLSIMLLAKKFLVSAFWISFTGFIDCSFSFRVVVGFRVIQRKVLEFQVAHRLDSKKMQALILAEPNVQMCFFCGWYFAALPFSPLKNKVLTAYIYTNSLVPIYSFRM